MKKAIVINCRDNVAVALTDLNIGEIVTVFRESEAIQVTIKEKISFGHKISVTAIAAGEEVLKYGEPIGLAIKNIDIGEHVHTHNLVSQRCR